MVVRDVEKGASLRQVMARFQITAERVWKAIERHVRRSKR